MEKHQSVWAAAALLGVPLAMQTFTGCAFSTEGEEEAASENRTQAVHTNDYELERIRAELRLPSLLPTELYLAESTACAPSPSLSCEPGTFCKSPPGACHGSALLEAQCAALPESCPAELDPVCGCDGTTYGNACQAYQNGQSVAYGGHCAAAASGDTCGGGVVEPQCEAGLFCMSEPGACREPLAAWRGTCAEKPAWCTQEWDPVCGCDGTTYGNECVASANGVSVAYFASCDVLE